MASNNLALSQQTPTGLMIVPRWALAALQFGVGVVCLIGAIQLLLHVENVGQHPNNALMARGIALSEVLAVVLFWIPRGRRVGGIMLILVLVLAAIFHVWIGDGFPLPPAAYASAVVVPVYASKQDASKVKYNDR